jgi:hypothetical protein
MRDVLELPVVPEVALPFPATWDSVSVSEERSERGARREERGERSEERGARREERGERSEERGERSEERGARREERRWSDFHTKTGRICGTAHNYLRPIVGVRIHVRNIIQYIYCESNVTIYLDLGRICRKLGKPLKTSYFREILPSS